MAEEWWESDPAYQYLARSVGYLEAAKIIVENGGNRPPLRAPILHLVAHGLEVLFKFELIRNGRTVSELQKEFGHYLKKLWDDEGLKAFQSRAHSKAKIAWDMAERSGKCPDNFRENPKKIIDEYIDHLSELHTRKTGYALRYIALPGVLVPVPLFLIDTFLPVANEIAKEYMSRD